MSKWDQKEAVQSSAKRFITWKQSSTGWAALVARYGYSLGVKVRVKPCRVKSSCNRPVWMPATTAAHKAYSLQPDKVQVSQLERAADISTDTAACVTYMTRSSQHEATADVKTEELTLSWRQCRCEVGVSSEPQWSQRHPQPRKQSSQLTPACIHVVTHCVCNIEGATDLRLD